MRAVHVSRRFFAAAALCVVGVVVLSWTVLKTRDDDTSLLIAERSLSPELRHAAELGGIKAAKAADVPLALLGDYYEHVIEHAPPRSPGGAMQRRERFYRAPGDPFDLIRSYPTKCEADALLRRQLEKLEAAWTHGEVMPATSIRQVESLAGQSSLTAETLLSAGRAFDFLAGDEVAAAFFRPALAKAQEQFKSLAPGEPAEVHFLHELDQTKALWRLKDYAALAQRFGLAASLYPPLSADARRAGCLQAGALYNEGLISDAARLIVQVRQQDNQVGDLGASDPGDVAEMDWEAGLYLASARRYDEAIPYYEDLLRTQDRRKPLAVRYLMICLRHVGKDKQADDIRSQYPLVTNPPATRPTASRARSRAFSVSLKDPEQQQNLRTSNPMESSCHG